MAPLTSSSEIVVVEAPFNDEDAQALGEMDSPPVLDVLEPWS